MKFLCALLLGLSTNIFAQDLLVKIDGDSIESKIVEVGINEVRYRQYNYLNGPLYVISKNDISKIVFENGSTEFYPKNEVVKEMSFEETKAVIIEYFDKYAFYKNGRYKYDATFDNDYLYLSITSPTKSMTFPSNRLYDFTGRCGFQKLSLRNWDISYINVYVNTVIKKKKGKYKVKKGRTKLVIRVKGQENGKILRDALIRYNKHFITKPIINKN